MNIYLNNTEIKKNQRDKALSIFLYYIVTFFNDHFVIIIGFMERIIIFISIPITYSLFHCVKYVIHEDQQMHMN